LITNKNSIAQIKKVDLDKLPITKAYKVTHDKLESLAEKMLEIKKNQNQEK
jgi:hypothetical protein